MHTDNLRDRKSAIYDAFYGFVSVVVRVLAWALIPLVEVTGDSQITNVTSGSLEPEWTQMSCLSDSKGLNLFGGG